MKYLILRNEKTISDIADKAYKGLTAKSRKQVEASLLKANPELKKIRSVRKGFIIRVPDIHASGEKNSRNLIDPIEGLASDLEQNLKIFEESLKQKFSNLENRQKGIAEKLKVANKELNKIPNGEEAGKVLRKHLTASKKVNEKNKKLALEALEKLKKSAMSLNR